MAIPLVINGAVFEYPQNFDEDWGVDATGWAQAVTAGALYLSGGSFPLTNTVDFGASFGLIAKSVSSKTTNPASAGVLRLAKTDAIEWRNNANSGDLALSVDGSDLLNFNGTPLGLTALTNGAIFVGNASNVPTAVTLSGDITITNTAVATIANSAITNAKVSASAAIAVSKLAALTASRAAQTDSSGILQVSAVTSTELGFVGGVTSAIQTQLGTKLPLAGGTMSGAINMGSQKITSLANGTVSTDATAFGQVLGQRIIQSVQVTSTTPTTTASTTYVITNTVATITPTSASNKIRVTVSGMLTSGSGSNAVVGTATLQRGSTNLLGSNGFAIARGNANVVPNNCTFVYVDSPATTSATVYAVFIKTPTSNLNWGDDLSNPVTTCIILEEIG